MPPKHSVVLERTPIRWSVVLERALRDEVGEEVCEYMRKRARRIRVERIVYRSGGHRVTGFIVAPRRVRTGETLPCLIFNRGGSLEFGAIDMQRLFGRIGRMAEWGYVVVASQYSGNDGSEGRDEHGGADVQDVLNLRNVLREEPSADLSRIGMWGGSRGGMMTYLALTRAKWLRAAVVVAGVSDLAHSARVRPGIKKRFRQLFGGSAQALKQRSAVHWADKFPKKTPVLLMHGTADWRVNPEQSIRLSQQFLEHRIPHRLVLFEGADHMLTECREESMRLTREWLDRFVRDRAPLPNLRPHGD